MSEPQNITESNEAEIWLPIPEYEGHYLISNLGRVWSLSAQRTRALYCGPNGYLSLALYRENREHRFYVHALVLAAFVGPCPPGHEVNHIDFNRLNNRLSNLEYITHLENMRHTTANGRMPHGESHRQKCRLHASRGTSHYTRAKPELVIKGERHYNAKITADDVREIRRRRESGESQRSIASDYGITRESVSRIVLRRNWKHI